MEKFCENCGAKLNENAAVCVKCGGAINNTNKVVAKEKKPNNAFCLTGFILGLVSLLIDLFGIVGICGIVFSAIGLNQVKTDGKGGKGLAIAGLVLSIFDVVYKFFYFISLIVG